MHRICIRRMFAKSFVVSSVFMLATSAFAANETRSIDQSHFLSKIAQANTSQDASDWADLPGWQGLPSGTFDKFDSSETENKSAQEMYDKAYRQLLVGDLEDAEKKFRKLMLHYQSSPIAKKAQKQLARIHYEKRLSKNIKDYDYLNSHVELPNSTIRQFSIISRTHPFQPDVEEKTPINPQIPLAKTGVQNGTIDDFVMNIGDRIFFDKASTNLTNEAKKLLISQAEWLKQNKKYKLLIEGHAHEQGSKDYNYDLSKNRAAQVRKFFIAQGINPDRIKVLSYGNAKPIALCQKNSCYTQNRRVVTRLSTSLNR